MEHKKQNDNPKTRSFAKIYEHNTWQSFKSHLVKGAMRLMRIKSDSSWEKLSKPSREPQRMVSPGPTANLYKEFQVISSQINGSNVYRLQPKQNMSSQVILYLHGGAYVGNSSDFHWQVVQQLIRDNNCTVIYPDYPLAPEASHVECFLLLDALYQHILSEVDPKNLVFMGDSAGGGLCLAFSQKLKKEGLPQPSQLILLSPWLDITCTNPGMLEIEKYECLLNINGLKKCGQLWANGTDLKNPLVSPLYGDIEGLPLISIFASTHDILEPDMRKFRDICDSKGVAINYFNYHKMIHGWMLFGLPESSKTQYLSSRAQRKQNLPSYPLSAWRGLCQEQYHFSLEYDQQFIQNNNCTIIYPDYPLAPEASYVEGFKLLDTLYQQILSEVDPKNLVLMGDSAGGGMSLAFAQKLKKEGAKLPSQLILLTPWLDISCTNPEMLEVDKYDPTININLLSKCGELWAKGIDLKNPLVSPVYGDVDGLPLISVFAGTHDVLGVDAKKFRDICDAKGVPINYFNYPKMIHLWMLFGFPESAKVIEQVGELLSKTK